MEARVGATKEKKKRKKKPQGIQIMQDTYLRI